MTTTQGRFVSIHFHPPCSLGVRAPGGDAESVEKRGLLWLLDEEAIFPGSSDESFVERLMLQQVNQPLQFPSMMHKELLQQSIKSRFSGLISGL